MSMPAWIKGRLGTEPMISRMFYDLILKRSSTYMTAIMITATTVGARTMPAEPLCPEKKIEGACGGARSIDSLFHACRVFIAGIGYDYAMDGVWNVVNKGKLWKDIKDSALRLPAHFARARARLAAKGLIAVTPSNGCRRHQMGALLTERLICLRTGFVEEE